MPTALFLSPHLDDAAFSCGGLMAQLADAGWRTVMMTAFTASVLPATGFALACQLDKGLDATVDYMALRRNEDREAAAILGVTDLRWLDLPEAPHRGYGSATELFGPIKPDDNVWQRLAEHIAAATEEMQPDLVLGPQGLGNHVDHRQMIRAVFDAATQPVAFYRDTPYAMRDPNACSHADDYNVSECVISIAQGLDRKVEASCAYGSQIVFQFGGAASLGVALREFAVREGQGRPAERFLASGRALELLAGSHHDAIL